MPKAAAKRTNTRNSTADKRSSILRAATRVFARNGYFNSKVADIARAADVADGTVYLYFKSKEEILHSIFDQNIATLSRQRASLFRMFETHARSCGGLLPCT